MLDRALNAFTSCLSWKMLVMSWNCHYCHHVGLFPAPFHLLHWRCPTVRPPAVLSTLLIGVTTPSKRESYAAILVSQNCTSSSSYVLLHISCDRIYQAFSLLYIFQVTIAWHEGLGMRLYSPFTLAWETKFANLTPWLTFVTWASEQ